MKTNPSFCSRRSVHPPLPSPPPRDLSPTLFRIVFFKILANMFMLDDGDKHVGQGKSIVIVFLRVGLDCCHHELSGFLCWRKSLRQVGWWCCKFCILKIKTIASQFDSNGNIFPGGSGGRIDCKRPPKITNNRTATSRVPPPLVFRNFDHAAMISIDMSTGTLPN